MEKAIQKAIEGGYVTGFRYDKLADMDGIMRAGEILFLDPLFWQALGKSLGWNKRVTEYYSFTDGKINNDVWRIEWHRFIDHLAEGKSINDFFNSLLK